MSILLNAIFPKFCIICNELGTSLCERCKKNLKLISFDTCIVCDGISVGGSTHKSCSNSYTPDSYISFCSYNNISRQIVLKAKYGQKSYTLLETLIYLKENLAKMNSLNDIDIITPVPMTKSTQKARGTNHALYIAKKISEIKHLPIIDLLIKNSRKSQKQLTGETRRYNLRGKILIQKQFITHIQNKSILLVDDVLTTGATMIESSKVLKTYGAKKITCLTLTKDEFHNV
ncbi:hypothetical protein CO058_02865 [candidate division WWE3 bacterium CG_4_9_14_0_2_um_filter_35_11]|uniref:Uncharacterized protein n=1 Tax=candidate division WWE3 bacterium CG_4_9_14_0_2_um_filter_35_11 TaxID=1975077 RepID=A0A2M8ELA7_UNCKA|nr:MAG: hypothetical protein COV25_01795 [candidate division WWE3 bacterium CG10_big_fil_rev_8_21_14_0_10_35_32]PJC23524.1 MAG: hypothetical protein CO058_02865 [candidate division WWE3 bacterium CG_4_9_14_0_2_um_filter_35_11]